MSPIAKMEMAIAITIPILIKNLPNTSVTILIWIIGILIRVQAQKILILYFSFFSNIKRHIMYMIKTYIIKTQSGNLIDILQQIADALQKVYN